MSESSLDVLAAQVRQGFSFGEHAAPEAKAALDALVARCQRAELLQALAEIGDGEVERLRAERDALVARVTEAEARADEGWRTANLRDDSLRRTLLALADARNALEQITTLGDGDTLAVQVKRPYLAEVRLIAREVLARLDGNQP